MAASTISNPIWECCKQDQSSWIGEISLLKRERIVKGIPVDYSNCVVPEPTSCSSTCCNFGDAVIRRWQTVGHVMPHIALQQFPKFRSEHALNIDEIMIRAPCVIAFEFHAACPKTRDCRWKDIVSHVQRGDHSSAHRLIR